MAFIKLVYETAAARAFKKRGNVVISSDDLLRGFEQAKGYYTQMETPDDRNAGFVAEQQKRLMEDQNMPVGGEVEKVKSDSTNINIEPTHVVSPSRTGAW